MNVQNDFRFFQGQCFTFLEGLLLAFARNEKQASENKH